MQQRDLAGKVQTQTRPTRLRLVEGLEDILVLFDRNSRPFIAHFDAACLVDGYGDRAAAAAMVDGIAHEICQRALDLQDVDLDMGLVRRGLEGKVIAGLDGKRREVGGDPADEVAEIDDLATSA